MSFRSFIFAVAIPGLLACFLTTAAFAGVEASDHVEKVIPSTIGDFRSLDPPKALSAATQNRPTPDPDSAELSGWERVYRDRAGNRYVIQLTETRSEDSAFAGLMSLVADFRKSGHTPNRIEGVQTLGFQLDDRIAFYKGIELIVVRPERAGAGVATRELVDQISAGLQSVDNDIPSLVKHLPDWSNVRDEVQLAMSAGELNHITGDQPIFGAIDFSGGTEAVVANYGQSQMIIAEFTTPQLATANDNSIQARLRDLASSGQTVPTSYKRVGNYGVFVFNAADVATADGLIKQVSYEQVVQWLGNNPNILRRAQHAYAATTANIVLSVIKASGISLILCLGLGGLFGAYIFKKRRMRLAEFETYSDSGGMIRLGIDDLNVQADNRRLLNPPQGR